jgi:hypothetical protein
MEKTFFKTIVIISLVGCAAVILLDWLVLKRFDTNFHIIILLAQVLLVTLYGLNKMKFSRITTGGIVMMCGLFTFRGFHTTDFNEITYTLLITLGFISSLVLARKSAAILTVIILGCLLALLFKDRGNESMAVLFRKAIPYLTVFCIVTICSGILKSKYEKNQSRLRGMVDILNAKNQKIKDQHILLKTNYNQLAELNGNLEAIISQKTEKIQEKNKQLAEIAYANAHTIRGPLARILGLLHLTTMDPDRKELYLCKIMEEANDMDGILQIVTRQIEMNIHK